ncbi:MAG: NAD(P)-binding domain-containing protein [Verrucomicrobia bacterium]|nr:NAD(P)-binding domain-containing protein [Verrucomicrobiota bacterium]
MGFYQAEPRGSFKRKEVTLGDSTNQQDSLRRVAIIGSGPGGLVAARYLKQHGFEPVVFEQADEIGGQWNVRSAHSGIWPSMVTNTSRLLTCFSDLAPEPSAPIFPPNQEILAYLKRYARLFGLLSHVRFNTRVELIERDPDGGGWLVRSSAAEKRSEKFLYVVVASGRFNKPLVPSLPGLELFRGAGGTLHSFDYKDPESFRHKRVLVVGCAISALEIASDLAMLGTLRVVSTFRRQRYVMQKLVAGVPGDALAFTRFAALNAEVTPKEILSKTTQDYILRVFGSPEQFGAFRPAGDFLSVGRALSQHFLPLVAEGRIAVKPWISEIHDRKVRFLDESSEEFDAIIFGTGFELSMPFLNPTISSVLDLDTQHADLYKHTFHPDLAGLAFLGLWEQTGPYFPPLELQARWITYVWSGIVPFPRRDQMNAGIAAYRSKRGESQLQAMHLMALLFAREANVEPDLREWPQLARALLFGPLSAISFRLSGPDHLRDAAERVATESRVLGTVRSAVFSSEQVAQLQVLADARRDSEFARFVDRIAKSPEIVSH